MRSIAGLFGRSPFGPLQAHMTKALACAKLLRPLLDALIARDDERVENLINEICALEREADEIKNTIRDRLPRSLFLPAARSDLLVLLEVQDAIADAAQDVAILLRIRKVVVPEEFRDDVLRLLDYSLQSSERLQRIFEKLSDLLESSFRGKTAAQVSDEIRVVGEVEHEADKIALSLFSRLFKSESQLSVPDLIIWDKLIGNISRVADLSEKAANRMRIIIAH